MKVVILAGGYGTRISEETGLRPKPMVEIGGKPILWHIMKFFYTQGHNDFIILCGYKSNLIKEYFNNYSLYQSNAIFDTANNRMHLLENKTENWKVTLLETGDHTMTGGRLKQAEPYIGNEDFFFTYGDGLSDINLGDLISFHRKQDVLATVTAVQPPGRFGSIIFNSEQTKVKHFQEKPIGDGVWINGGYFILNPKVISLIKNDQTSWEEEPMTKLAQKGLLAAYKHQGFWHPMDTLRDKCVLEEMWESNKAPWKNW
jgi:glucose-1-phosphate cytidylyltransferase